MLDSNNFCVVSVEKLFGRLSFVLDESTFELSDLPFNIFGLELFAEFLEFVFFRSFVGR